MISVGARRPVAFSVALAVVWAITLVGMWALYAWEDRWTLTGGFCSSYNAGPMRCGEALYAWEVGTSPLRLAIPLAIAVVILSPLGCALGHVLERRSMLLHLAAFSVLGFTIGGLWWVIGGPWFLPVGGLGFALLLAGAVPISWAFARRIARHGSTPEACQ